MIRIGSDTGGTFTDLVLDDGTVCKVPSSPDDPGAAVRAGMEELIGAVADLDDPRVTLAHGTTVATNALLERRGGVVALVTNEGMADLIEIARQDRPSLYDGTVDRPLPVVERSHRHEVPGRLDAHGRELVPVDVASIPELDPDVESVAVCLLHSDLDARHEQLVAEELRRRGHDVTCSSELSPEMREYERASTVAINAYLRPACRSYLRALGDAAHEVLVMTSAGGLTPVADAADRPAALLLSGPAGGVLAGAAIAQVNGYRDAITFDMGGTSTDVCLVLDGRPEPASAREVAGLPVRLPSLDIHTIGAGGGSIARIDDGGALRVGPQSAGARPGPACYGHGGTSATVTDANVVAGHIPANLTLPGLGPVHVEAAHAALSAAGLEASGVLAVVNANMEAALRTVSVERGVDPRGLALVAFGGAGPLHACALADALGMPAVIIPPRAGVFSAVGILGAPLQHDLVHSCAEPTDHLALPAIVDEVIGRARAWTDGFERGDDDALLVSVDVRYAGQSHELNVAWSPSFVDTFHDEHERRNGYARRQSPVEVVAVRVKATVAAPLRIDDLPPVERSARIGPAAIAEPDCTIWLAEGWQAGPGAGGALILTRVGSGGNPERDDEGAH